MENKQAALEKARAYAFLLLKFRPRSSQEISDRLKQKKYPSSVTKETVEFLKEKKFLNDAQFAGLWINSRLNCAMGFNRIRNELALKGIDKKIIDSSLGKIAKEYSEGKVVKELAQARMARLKNIEPLKAKKSVFGYLARRGFDLETIMDVLEQL